MSKFNDILIEMAIISGFNDFEVTSTDDFIKTETDIGNSIRVDVKTTKKRKPNKTLKKIQEALDTTAEITPVNIDELKKKRMDKPSQGVDLAERPEKMLHKSNIVDENGNLLDNETLKKKITQRPDKIIGQNTKLSKSGGGAQNVYDLTLPSYMGLFVDESTGEFKVVKTCPSAGACSKFCYAAKGGYVMFPASSLSASKTVNYLMNDPEGFKSKILAELRQAENQAKRNKKTVTLRWHDSGDFLSESYLRLAFDIAKENPNVLHYAYTKQIPLVQQMEAEKPENFVFNYSFGGKHDEMINPLVDKHARVLPKTLFTDLPHTKTSEAIEFTPAAIDMLKTRASNEYKVDKKSIITYDELMQTPIAPNKKWNVLVWKGHGDDAGSRKDVLGVYLLFH
jgi:hypothetical protein